MALQLGRCLDDVDLVSECLLDKIKGILECLGHLLVSLAVAEIEVSVYDGHELLLLVLPEHVRDEFVRTVCEIQDLDALVLEDLSLRHLVHCVEAVACSVVDVFLILFHSLNVLSQCDRFLLS